MEKFLRLEAVVELSIFKEDLPKWDLPDFKLLDSIRLWKGITFDEISLVIAQIAGYNDSFNLSQSKKNILEQIIAFRKDEDNGLIVSGGVIIRSESKVIHHGCCSGLEMWREIIDDIQNKENPWMGHDPDPILNSMTVLSVFGRIKSLDTVIKVN